MAFQRCVYCATMKSVVDFVKHIKWEHGYITSAGHGRYFVCPSCNGICTESYPEIARTHVPRCWIHDEELAELVTLIILRGSQ